jgi:hypothetical protein
MLIVTNNVRKNTKGKKPTKGLSNKQRLNPQASGGKQGDIRALPPETVNL